MAATDDSGKLPHWQQRGTRGASPRYQFRLPDSEREQWERAAEILGTDLSKWIRATCTREARKVVNRDRLGGTRAEGPE